MAYDVKSAIRAGWRRAAASPWVGTAILMITYAFAFIDRQILSLLVEPIKHDLHLSDSQLSLLLGLAFVAVGLPGLLVAVLVAMLAEPERRGGGPVTPHLRDVYAYLRTWWLPILLSDVCLAFVAMTGYSLTAWIPSFFIRTYGWTSPEIGQRFGLVIVLSGIVGYVTGGWAGDVLVARGMKAGRLVLVVAAALIAIPLAIAAPLAGDGWHALVLYGATLCFVTMGSGLIPAVQLGLVPAGMRGLAISLGTLVVNSLGLGLGPTMVALITDYVIRDETKIRYALAAAPPAMLLACILCGVACATSYVRCVRRLETA